MLSLDALSTVAVTPKVALDLAVETPSSVAETSPASDMKGKVELQLAAASPSASPHSRMKALNSALARARDSGSPMRSPVQDVSVWSVEVRVEDDDGGIHVDVQDCDVLR